VKIRPI